MELLWGRRCLAERTESHSLLAVARVLQDHGSGTFDRYTSFDYTDGKNPNAGLVQATNFMGLLRHPFYGGALQLPYGWGTVFKITPTD